MSFGRSGGFPDYGSTSIPDTPPQPSRATGNLQSPLYHQLCDNISCNIFSINNHVTGLEKASKEIGTQADTVLLRDKIHKSQQNTNELVGSTARFLKDLKSLVQRGGKEQRLQSERLENEFCATVQRYEVLQKQLAPKLKYSVPHKSLAERSGAVEWGVDDEQEKESLMDSEKLQQQQMIQEELEFEQGLLLEREERIRQIESDMLDVNQVFRDLASMVHEQGDVIGTIEENVSTTAQNVEEGTNQLSKASEYQKKYRKKLCWFIIILLIVATALALIILSVQHK